MNRVPAWGFGVAAILLLSPSGVMDARAGTEEVAVVTTPQGEFVWRFLSQDAPEHVAYVKLTKDPMFAHQLSSRAFILTTFARAFRQLCIPLAMTELGALPVASNTLAI